MPDSVPSLPPVSGAQSDNAMVKKKKGKDAPKKGGPMAEIEASMASISGGAKTAAAIARIQDQQDDYSRKADHEQKKLHELTVEVNKLERTLLEEKVRMGGKNAQKDSEDAIGKQVKNLEKRLDKAKVKYNDAIAYNKHLCEEIDTTRYELLAGQGAIKEQQKLVQVKQEELREMAEDMQESYLRRDQAHHGVHSLKADAVVAEREFREQWDTMKTVLAEDAKRQHEANRKELRAGKHTMAEDKAAKTVELLGHGIQQGRWAAANAQDQETAANAKTADIESAMERIFKATNMGDVDSLCEAFIERSESEMRQLLLTQEMDDQIHKAQEEIMVFRIAIEEVHGRGKAAEDGRRKMEDHLQDRLAQIEKKIGDADEELASSAEAEAKIIPRVVELHKLLGGLAPRTEPDENGLVTEKVDIRWMVSSLAELVEPKITSLCAMYASQAAAPSPAADAAEEIDADYARMVEQAKTSGADMAKLWMVDRDSSEEEDADQSSRWTLRIQPPSIRGVVVDSDEDENYDDGRRSPPPGSPDKGMFMSREQIKKTTAAIKARASKSSKGEDDG